jgi:hypothetical protein
MSDYGDGLPSSSSGHLQSLASVGLSAKEIANIVVQAIEYKKVSLQLEARLQEFREAFDKYGESEHLELARYRFQSEMTLLVIKSLIENGNPQHAVEVFSSHVNSSAKILENAANFILEYRRGM